MQLLIILFLSWSLLPSSFSLNGLERDTETGNRIAISFDSNLAYFPSQTDLDNTLKAGIQLIEFSDPAYFNSRNIDDFFILVGTPDRYVTMNRLESDRENFIQSTINRYHAFYQSHSNKLAAIKLFHFPADFNSSFINLSNNFVEQLSEEINLPFYYQSSEFQITESSNRYSPYRFISTYHKESDETTVMPNSVIYFDPGHNVQSALSRLEELLVQSLELEDSIIIIPSDWFYERLQAQPDLILVFSNYARGNVISFPYPNIEDPIPPIDPKVILLLLIWILLICLYKYRPNFLETLYRYYFNHSFFATDTMENRKRNFSDAFIVLLIHILVVALFFYSISTQLFSQNGLNSLSHNLPLILISGKEPLSFFVLGLIVSTLSHFISIFWIYLLNKSMNKMGQAIQLYAWGLSVNFLIVTMIVALSFWDSSQFLIYILSLFFLLTWFMSFNIAAIDGARSLDKRRVLNIFLTFGLHSILIIGLIISALMNPEIYELFELAFHLR